MPRDTAREAVLIREITETDLPSLIQFFAGELPARVYIRLFEILRNKPTPKGPPKYGYLLNSGGKIAGGIILISTAITAEQNTFVRTHLTLLKVGAEFQGYGAFLMKKAQSNTDVSYISMLAQPSLWPIIEAQGFVRYSFGQFGSVPLLSAAKAPRFAGKVIPGHKEPDRPYEPFELDLMLDHTRYGCICFWCVTEDRAYPFVFQSKILKRVLKTARLIYCRHLSDLSRFARPIGLALARRGHFAMCNDANGPVPGLVGKYFGGIHPRWYKGMRPRIGDLAYTLPAMCWPFE